jgi:hypothetical protein
MTLQLRQTKKAHPAYQWEGDHVKDILAVCYKNGDIAGADSIFGQLNQEHICFFGYDFRERTPKSALPASSIERTIVLNCALAVQVHQLIHETILEG